MITEFPKEGNIYIDVEGINIEPLQKYLEENGRRYTDKCPTYENYLVWDSNNFWYTTNKSTNKKLYTLLDLEPFITAKVEESVKVENFILPTKWCVKGSPCKTVQQFFLTYKNNNIQDLVVNGYTNYYFHSETVNNDWQYPFTSIQKGFTEITLEQFMEHVYTKDVKKSLVGRYLKVLKKFSDKFEINDYLLIRNDDDSETVITDKYGVTARNRFKKNDDPDLELMPEGFTPPTDKDLLLEEAKRRYPIGTKVICNLGSFDNQEFTRDGELFIDCVEAISASGEPYVYFKGKWAEIVEDYQNLLDIEEGDTVKCISEDKSKFSFYAGSGWQKDLEFVVTKCDDYSRYKIYSGGKNENGVYSDAVRLVKKKEKPVETPKYEVGKWYRLPKTSNYIIKYSKPHWCDEFIDYEKHNNWGGKCNTTDAILVDVSEIQKYLPDGHVDKIKVDVIPEYVECIQDDFHKAWDNTKGKIYKVENGKILSNTSKPGIYIESSLGKSHFKPSTKEAYDKQFMSTYKCLPFPKDNSYFTARVVKDIQLRHKWSSLPDIIPAGSITWCYSEKGGDYKSILLNKRGDICPEGNRYCANIPAEYFEILETFTIEEPKVEYVSQEVEELFFDEKKGNPLEKKVISIYIPPSKVEGKKEVLFSVLKLKQIKKIF